MSSELKNRAWRTVKIKDFGAVLTGNTPSTKNKEYYGGQFKLISPADLNDSKYITTSHKLLTQNGLRAARTVPKNSILVGCIGNIGKIAITSDEVSAFNQQINAIVCNENFDSNFIYYLLKFNRGLLESKASKVTLPILNKNNFENIELECPPLHEQMKISKLLDTVYHNIESSNARLSAYQKLFTTLLHELMSGERRVDGN